MLIHLGCSQTDLDDGLRIWRSFKMGKLLDLIILDTRNYDRSITSLGTNPHHSDHSLLVLTDRAARVE